MKQILQDLDSGETRLADVPCPQVARGNLLIKTEFSVISAGTERMLVEFGKANLLQKARQQPDRVQEVLNKMKSDGILPTLERVFQKLGEPLPLGYCNCGIIMDLGDDVRGFQIGDRVASNGPHAEVVQVPVNLCARVPSDVAAESAAFTPLAAIALQGVRLLGAQIGERVVVFGMGLVGQLTAQILMASGIRVLAIDVNESRLQMVQALGAQTFQAGAGRDPLPAAASFSDERGVDGVILAASTSSSEIANQAAQMCRKRGKVVLVGVTGLELDRAAFYEKEISLQVSCSYGPGRYDPVFEQKGVDYPFGFVRWTEKRNMQAVLELIQLGKLKPELLVSERIPFSQAPRAYEKVLERNALGLVLDYTNEDDSDLRASSVQHIEPSTSSLPADQVTVGFIGAGTFSKSVLLPGLRQTPAKLMAIASRGGVSAAVTAEKFGFEQSTTDYREILGNPSINTVFITTRHNQHAALVVEALSAGKHVFVEKPLAITREELAMVDEAVSQAAGQQLLVGFNRRFAPLVQIARKVLSGRSSPMRATMMVNAGQLPSDHWLLDPEVGGGRIIGECCHWIDLFDCLVKSEAVEVRSSGSRDDAVITILYADGSLATLQYFTSGHRSFPKERLTLFCEGRTLELDNFRQLRGYGCPTFTRKKLLRQDKGHRAELAAFVKCIVDGGPPLIPFESIRRTTEICIEASATAWQAT